MCLPRCSVGVSLLLSCLLLRERVCRTVAQKWPRYIRPSRGHCIATALHATTLRAIENGVLGQIVGLRGEVCLKKLRKKELHNLNQGEKNRLIFSSIKEEKCIKNFSWLY
jgi:hypothetical protein